MIHKTSGHSTSTSLSQSRFPRRNRFPKRPAEQDQPRYGEPVPAGLGRMAAYLAKKHKWIAEQWAGYARLLSDKCWDVKYMVFSKESFESTDALVPLPVLYAMGIGLNRSDPQWGSKHSWRLAAEVCPYGLVVALFIHGMDLLQQKGTSALEQVELHLALAHDLMGPLAELDLLDFKAWGFSSRDLDLQLLSVSFPFKAPLLLGLSETAVEVSEPKRLSGLSDMWPAQPISDWRDHAWHALQLNSIVRSWLKEGASQHVQHGEKQTLPALVLLAWPDYLSLFIVPMLERLTDSLQLSIFHLGQWEKEHPKCSSCMKSYAEKYVVNTPGLQEIVMRKGLMEEALDQQQIDWTADDMSSSFEFLATLRHFAESNALVRRAAVFLCTAPPGLPLASVKVFQI